MLTEGIWLFLARATGIVSLLVVTALLSRAMSPADFGHFVLANSVIGVGSAFAILGLNYTAVAEVIPFKNDVVNYWKAIYLITSFGLFASITIASLLTTLTILVVYLVNARFDVSTAQLIFIGVWFCFGGFSLLITEVLRSTESYRLSAWLGSPSSSLITLCLLALVESDSVSFEEAILMHTFGFGSTCLFGLLFLSMKRVRAIRQGSQKSEFENNTETTRRPGGQNRLTPSKLDESLSLAVWLSRSLPAFGGSSLTLLMSQIDLWFLSFVGTIDQVATYAIAVRLGQVTLVPSLLSAQLVATRIARHGRSDQDTRQLSSLVRKLSFWSAVPGITLLLINVFFGETLWPLAFGSNAAGARDIVSILIASQILAVLCGLGGAALTNKNLSREVLRCTLCALAAQFILFLVSAAAWNPYMIALISGSTLILQKLLLSFVAWRELGLWCFVIPIKWPAGANLPLK